MPPVAAVAAIAGAAGTAIAGGEAAKAQGAAAQQATEQAQAELRAAQERTDAAALQGRQDIATGAGQAAGSLQDAYAGARSDINASTGRAAGSLNQLAGMDSIGAYDVTGARSRLGDLYDKGFDFQADPGYQFRQQQGERALDRAASARGGRSSGRLLQELGEFNQGLASQEYNQAFQRRMGLASAADSSQQQLLLNQAGRSDNAALAAQGYQAQGMQGLANLYANQGGQLAGMGMQAGGNLANLYAGQGGQMAGIGMQAAGQNAQAAGGIANAYMMPVQYAGGELASYANSGQQYMQMGSNLVGQGAGAATAALCDRRAKDAIAPADAEIEAFLDAIKPYTYEYAGVDEKVTHFGVMAQDVAQSEAGASAVFEVDGMKYIDYRRALLLSMAALANMNGRLRALEASK